jgi:hypothetical protein
VAARAKIVEIQHICMYLVSSQRAVASQLLVRTLAAYAVAAGCPRDVTAAEVCSSSGDEVI